MVLEEDTFLGKLSAGRRDARRRGYGSGSNELMKAVASKDLEKMKETLVGGVRQSLHYSTVWHN